MEHLVVSTRFAHYFDKEPRRLRPWLNALFLFLANPKPLSQARLMQISCFKLPNCNIFSNLLALSIFWADTHQVRMHFEASRTTYPRNYVILYSRPPWYPAKAYYGLQIPALY